jgi:hypothetical protein
MYGSTKTRRLLSVRIHNTHGCCHRRELAELLATKPWGDKTRRYFLTRPEEYREGLKAALGIWCAALEHVKAFAYPPIL